MTPPQIYLASGATYFDNQKSYSGLQFEAGVCLPAGPGCFEIGQQYQELNTLSREISNKDGKNYSLFHGQRILNFQTRFGYSFRLSSAVHLGPQIRLGLGIAESFADRVEVRAKDTKLSFSDYRESGLSFEGVIRFLVKPANQLGVSMEAGIATYPGTEPAPRDNGFLLKAGLEARF